MALNQRKITPWSQKYSFKFHFKLYDWENISFIFFQRFQQNILFLKDYMKDPGGLNSSLNVLHPN